MPDSFTHLSVFVASPGDLGPEREFLEEIFREVNLSVGRNLKIHLELLKWETHTSPDFGNEPQDVVNRQIGDNYDIFLGLLWGRFGTPTAEFDSGTEEEFNRAYTRYKKDPNSIRLMVYIKDEPIPPSKIEPDQIAKVQQFTKLLADEGGLYTKFTSIENFGGLIRSHLSEILIKFSQNSDLISPSNPKVADLEEDEHVGLDETIPEIVRLLEIHGDSLNKLTDPMRRFSEKIGETTKKIDPINKTKSQNLRLFNVCTEEMSLLSTQFEKLQDEIFSPLHRGIGLSNQLVSILSDFEDKPIDSLEVLTSEAIELHQIYDDVKDSILEVAEMFESIPRLTVAASKARKKGSEILTQYAESFEAAQKMLRSLTDSIESLG